jgi:hypothetical protein
MIKVGDKEVVLSETVFVPQHEEAELEIDLGVDDQLILVLAFEESVIKEDEKEKTKASFNISGEGNRGKITFKDWINTFGSSITKPIFFASDNGGNRISFLGNIVKLGEMYKVEIQLMRGGKE